MKVLFVRHAIAEDREQFAKTGMSDERRPLTVPGRKKMRRIAAGIATLVPRVDVVATSRLTRAVETAAVLCPAVGVKSPVELAQLAPGRRPGELLTWLKKHDPGQTIILIGHEPDLGRAISWMLSGMRSDFVPLKKGGACLIEFPGALESGAATLVWAMRPSHLRQLAK